MCKGDMCLSNTITPFRVVDSASFQDGGCSCLTVGHLVLQAYTPDWQDVNNMSQTGCVPYERSPARRIQCICVAMCYRRVVALTRSVPADPPTGRCDACCQKAKGIVCANPAGSHSALLGSVSRLPNCAPLILLLLFVHVTTGIGGIH